VLEEEDGGTRVVMNFSDGSDESSLTNLKALIEIPRLPLDEQLLR
jgi:hypothetical protein